MSPRMTQNERHELLSEVGRALQDFAVERFKAHGFYDVRGAAFWDAAAYVVEQMGDGDWRRPTPEGKEPKPTGTTGKPRKNASVGAKSRVWQGDSVILDDKPGKEPKEPDTGEKGEK